MFSQYQSIHSVGCILFVVDGYVDQLKLDEKTKASALLFEADLYLQQQRAEDAILSFEGAGKAGANPDLVADGIARANDLIANSIPLIELNEEEVQ